MKHSKLVEFFKFAFVPSNFIHFLGRQERVHRRLLLQIEILKVNLSILNVRLQRWFQGLCLDL